MSQAPPDAEKRPHVHIEHGIEREDPYYWMRDRDDPAVIAYLEAENLFTEAKTLHLADLRKRLYDEMLGRIQETDRTWPVRRGDWWYYSRTEQGRAYRIYCRSRAEEGGEEEVILDVNELAEGHDYISIGDVSVSPDHRYLAFSVDTNGREIYTLRIKDLQTGELLDDVIPEISPGVTWAADNRTLFWAAMDETLRPWRIHRHTLGQPGDPVVFQEDDERFRVGTHRTRSDGYVVLHCYNAVSTEIHVIDARRPDAAFRCLQPRQRGLKYSIEHQGGRFLVLTNDADDDQGRHTDDAVNFKLMEAPLDSTSKRQWRELIPHRPEVQLVDVDAFADHVVVTERDRGQLRLRVQRVSTGEEHHVEMPEPVHVAHVGFNPEYESTELRFGYGSMTTPPTDYRYDMATRTLTRLKEEPVRGYDRSRYRSLRLEATAPDGTAIPISLVHRADIDPFANNPVLLYGYGAYGITIDPEFSSPRVSLLDRGVVFAIAHPRGGGFLGRPWYERGKFERKRNTFGDFIACARHLIAEGCTSTERLAIFGGSAGGLLIGATINEAPELFRCAVAAVPFVDVLTTMLDETLPLTAGEWDEWGDPRDKTYYDYIHTYSPYDNVRATRYPDLLVVSGLNDPRVQYWEPTKWVAKLRDVVTGGEILLRTHMGAGHQGRSGRYGYLEDRAFEYAWILDKLGLADA